MLDIATDRTRDTRIILIHLKGRIDTLTAREFDEYFEELIQAGNRFFILSASLLEHISSAGIGSLIQFARRLEGLGGGAAFVDLNAEVRMLLDFFGLGAKLPVFSAQREARDHLRDLASKSDYSLEIRRDRVIRARPESQIQAEDGSKPGVGTPTPGQGGQRPVGTPTPGQRRAGQPPVGAPLPTQKGPKHPGY